MATVCNILVLMKKKSHECRELKPKGETNCSFLVLHLSSGVHTVKTVGSHLNSASQEWGSITTSIIATVEHHLN